MFEDLLHGIKEKVFGQTQTIAVKSQKLQNQKASLQRQLDAEFDKQVVSELAGESYDGNNVKILSMEISELEGRIEAFQRQTTQTLLDSNDRAAIMNDAAMEYKRIIVENHKKTISKYELDERIRSMMEDGKSIKYEDSERIFWRLTSSGLFEDKDKYMLRAEVLKIANLNSDTEYIELAEESRVLNDKHSRRFGYSLVWEDR